MKFDETKFWKHDNGIDAFFSITTVSFDDDNQNAIVHGIWCVQGVNAWWFARVGRLVVKPNQYTNWLPYKPKGIFKF